MGKAGPKSGLAKRREQVDAAGGLIKAGLGVERNAFQIWEAVKRQSRVANNQFKGVRYTREGLPDWGGMSTHQKMKVAQDFLVTAFMTPEIGVRFIEACMQDPIAMAKLTMSIMPKELHVDVEHKSGVVMLPMKAESVEAWLATVEKSGKGEDGREIIDVTPDAFWSDKIGGSDGSEGRGDDSTGDDPGPDRNLDDDGG